MHDPFRHDRFTKEDNKEDNKYINTNVVAHQFCPTNENVPFANHRSFASFTRWAAARFVSSNPCTGVTTSDEAVPDVCAEFAARESAAVRSRFAFDIFAEYQRPTRQQIKKKKREDSLTPTF